MMVMVVIVPTTVAVMLGLPAIVIKFCASLRSVCGGFSCVVHSLAVVVSTVIGRGSIVVIFWLSFGRPSCRLFRLDALRLLST